MSNVAEIEAALFKQVGGGWVFQAPNPWVFGRTSRYLVNDAQKAELLAIVTPRSPTLRIAAITAGILLWASAASIIAWAVSSHDEPTASDALAIFALVVVPIFLALVFALQRNLRRMQRVLADAPRTEERITARELRHAMAKAVSLRRSVFIGALWAVTCLFQITSSRDQKWPTSPLRRRRILFEFCHCYCGRRLGHPLPASRNTQVQAARRRGKLTIVGRRVGVGPDGDFGGPATVKLILGTIGHVPSASKMMSA